MQTGTEHSSSLRATRGRDTQARNISVSRFQFELATRADDAQLRGILAATPTDGHLRVSFRREPSFFDASVVDGQFRQVLACRDRSNQRLAGFGTRSVA